MSVFDKDAFLTASMTSAMDTKFTPIPIGEYKDVCYLNDIKLETVKNSEGGEDPQLHIEVVFRDDKLKAALAMTEDPSITDRLFLDYDKEAWKNGKLVLLTGPNKNIKLGMYRDAVGQNDPKKPWAPMMLKGMGPVTTKVSHRFNKQTGEGPYGNIDKVAKRTGAGAPK
jgi:hypothetical protein